MRKLVTKKMRRTNMYGEKEICFSVDPIYMCKGDCMRPSEYDRVDVSYHCKPRYSPETQRLIAECQERPLYELRRELVHLTEAVTVPRMCDAL